MTAEELLMMSDEIETYSADDALIVDAENKIILTPADGLLLGVESDEEAERIKFVCPRIVGDNIDLSTLQLRINYKNANGNKDSKICTDVTIDGNYVRFSWLLTRKVTKYKGTVKFIICAIRTQSDGSIKNEWNTTLAEGKVLEGLEVDISEEEFEEPKDIVLQLLGMLDEKASDISDAIEAQKAEVISAIQAEEARVMKTIPEDYTYVYNLAEENKQLKANAIKRTYSGETIVATDSSQAKFEGLRVLGRSEQVSTTGAQLGYIDILHNEYNGLTFIEDNGNIIVNGVSTSTTWNRLIKCELVAGEKYTLSSNKNLNLNIWDHTSSSSLGNKIFGETSKTFTAPNTGLYAIVLNGEEFALSNIKVNIMVNIGTEALPWEPYSGGKPSPSPDYPQTIESVGDDGSVDVGVYGKNLLKNTATTMTVRGVAFTVNDDGSVTIRGTATTNVDFYCNGGWSNGKNILGVNEGTYIVSGTGDANIQLYIIKSSTVMYSAFNGEDITMSVADGGINAVFYRVLAGKTVNKTIYPMIRLASITDSTYEPYTKQSLSVSTPSGLPAIKVTDASIATYTDADGVMWCADEVDFARGKYVQRIGVEVLDGSSDETWIIHDSSVTDKKRFAIDIAKERIYKPSNANEIAVALCTNLPVVCANDTYKLTQGISVETTGRISCYLEDYSVEETLNDFKNYLTENPMTFMFLLNTPIETDLTAEQLEVYRALHSNYPTTTILNDENAHMEVTLVADTKNHIEQNYVPLDSYKSLEERVLAVEQALA